MITISESQAGHDRKTARDMASKPATGPSKQRIGRLIAVFPLITLVVALLVLASDARHVASALRNVLFDAYQQAQPRTYKDTLADAGFSVRTLDIDAASLRRFGPWPWPRSTLAEVLRELKAEGAALAVLAFPLDVPDPLSPANLIAQVEPGPSGDAARAALSTMASPDIELQSAMSRLATVTGFTLGAMNASRSSVLKARVSFVGARNPFGRSPQFDRAAPAVVGIGQMSLGSGALNLVFDSDGKVRRMPLVFRLNDKPVPSITAEILRLIERKQHLVVRSDEGESGLLPTQAGITSVEALNLDLPTTPDGSLLIAFAATQTQREFSAADLAANKIPAGRLTNAVVIIGPPGDSIATPAGPRSVADVHAEALENLLNGASLHRPASANEAELICLAIFGIAGILVFVRFGVLWSGLFTSLSIAVVAAVSWRLYSANHLLFDALGPGSALAVVFVASALARVFEVHSARERVKAAFAQSLPSSIVGQIARKPELLSLDGVGRTVTYVCCGLRGFGMLADSFKDDPPAFTRLLQRVLEPLIDIASARGGTIDRLSIDGFSAFWNAPLDDAEHAIHACEAAGAMCEALARTNQTIEQESRADGVALIAVEIGIGISSSTVIAGGFEAHGRTAYSVTGDCTVVANRIQQLSAQYGPAIIVSEDTRTAAESDFAFLEVDYITAGAHEEPLKLHAMLGNPVMRASPKFRALRTFHDHIFRSLRSQQWGKARELIAQCRKLSGASQTLYDLHLARIAYFQENPPGSDWDGAFRTILK
jgi:adenylate cyclase